MVKRKIFKTVKGFICMIIGCGLMFSLLNKGVVVYQGSNQIAILEKEKKEVEKEKKALENEVNLLNDEDYVARYARENYVFARDGEQVTVIPGVE